MRTHQDGWEVSAKSLGKEYRWGRASVAEAYAELIDAGWLAIRRFENTDGHRLFDQYHVHVARRLDAEEAAKYGGTVVWSPKSVSSEDTSLGPFETPGWSESEQDRGLPEGIKEHQLQHCSEDQEDDPAHRELGTWDAATPGSSRIAYAGSSDPGW